VIERVDSHPDYSDAFSDLFADVPEIKWGNGGDDQEDGDGDEELIADGGRPIGTGDIVRVAGESPIDTWRVKDISDGEAVLWSVGEGMRRESVATLTVVRAAGESVTGDSDCGCECCKIGDERAYDVQSSEGWMDVVEGSGITAGDLVQYDGEEYRVRGWLLNKLILNIDGRNRHIDPDDVDVVDQELIADGGVELASGDTVIHAGEQWRVAKANREQVELYQLGSAPVVVPVGEVVVVPEQEVQY